MEPPPAVQYQQYHQYQEQSVASYSTILVATIDVMEQDAEEYGIPDGGYRSSRGFLFVYRRKTFVYYEENNFCSVSFIHSMIHSFVSFCNSY